MNIQDIQFLFTEYNYWANGKILAAASKVSQEQFAAPAEFPYGGLHGTMLHVVDAEFGWRRILKPKSSMIDLKADDSLHWNCLKRNFGKRKIHACLPQ